MNGVQIHDLEENSGHLAVDLVDVLIALGERGSSSEWLLEPLKNSNGYFWAIGDDVAEIFEVWGESGTKVDGKTLIVASAKARQVIDGKASGFDDLNTTSPWVVIIAVDSSWYEVYASDEAVLNMIRNTFKDVRPAGAYPEKWTS